MQIKDASFFLTLAIVVVPQRKRFVYFITDLPSHLCMNAQQSSIVVSSVTNINGFLSLLMMSLWWTEVTANSQPRQTMQRQLMLQLFSL